MERFLDRQADTAVEENIIDYLGQYPPRLLQEALKLHQKDLSLEKKDGFWKKKLYDLKEEEFLQNLPKNHPLYDFWNPSNRFSLLPITDQDCWTNYKTQMASFWTSADITFSEDKYDALPCDIKNILENILGFFAVGDGLVDENLLKNILPRIKSPEAGCMLMFQMSMENIHATVYGENIMAYIKDPQKRRKIFAAAQELQSVKLLTDWITTYLNNSRGLAENMVAFVIVENQMFQTLFAIIFWLKDLNYQLDGLYNANTKISIDEAQHSQATALLYREKLPEELQLSRTEVLGMIQKARDIQTTFIKETFQGKVLQGMTEDKMKSYIEFVSDHTLVLLGYKPEFYTPNPFKFMFKLGMERKAEFFCKRTLEYQHSVTLGSNVSMGEIDFKTIAEL